MKPSVLIPRLFCNHHVIDHSGSEHMPAEGIRSLEILKTSGDRIKKLLITSRRGKKISRAFKTSR